MYMLHDTNLMQNVMLLQKIVGVNNGVNQPIKRVLVACTQAGEFIDFDDLVTRPRFMDNYSVTVSVHAGLLGFAQHSKEPPLLTLQ